ncbi:MAG: DUF6020 family protein, partial [Eisenbergiella massiliensis]
LISAGKGLDFSNSFLSVLVFLLCFPVIHRSLWNGARSIWSFLMSLVLVTACCLGSRLEALGYVWLTDWHMWAAMPFLLLFFMLLTDGLWGILEDAGRYGKQEQEAAGIKRETLYIFLFFLLVWGIVLLAVYPGFFVYDAQDEFNQVAMRRFTTHHPLLHVVLLGGIISLGNKIFASYNAGIALYMVFQMLLMAGCFTYILSYFIQNRAPVLLRRAGVLYFDFFPVIQMYVLCSAKDTLYSAGMLLTIVLLLRLFREKAEFFSDQNKTALLLLSLFSMAAMRHNGFYILLLMIPVIILCAGKNCRVKAAATACTALLLYLLVSNGLAFVGMRRCRKTRKCSLCRFCSWPVYTTSPEVMTEEEKSVLLEVLPREALERYTPKLSDSVKIDFNNAAYKADPTGTGGCGVRGQKSACRLSERLAADLLRLLAPDAVIDIPGNTVFTYTYEDSSYFGFETELPGTRDSKIPLLNEWFRRLSLELFQQKVPVVSMLFSPGFLFLVYLSGLLFLMRRKQYKTVLAFLPAILNWLTVILGPTYLVRYVLIFWLALPVLAYVVSTGKLCYTNRN